MPHTRDMEAESSPSDQKRPHYHPIGITFHWAMALLVFVQMWWGWRVSGMDPGYEKLDGYGVHALIGAMLFGLALLRASWRIIAPFILPALEKPEDLPGWQRFAAEATHFALYAMMFILPLSGWIMLSMSAPAGVIALPGGFSLPAPPFIVEMTMVERARLEQRAENLHQLAIWSTLLLLTMHIGAALKHHFIDRDDVLSRMIPALRAAERDQDKRRPLDEST